MIADGNNSEALCIARLLRAVVFGVLGIFVCLIFALNHTSNIRIYIISHVRLSMGRPAW